MSGYVEECGGEFQGVVVMAGVDVVGRTCWFGTWAEAQEALRLLLSEMECVS